MGKLWTNAAQTYVQYVQVHTHGEMMMRGFLLISSSLGDTYYPNI